MDKRIPIAFVVTFILWFAAIIIYDNYRTPSNIQEEVVYVSSIDNL